MKKVDTMLLFCLIVAGLVCPGCKPSSSAQLEKNKALIRRCYEVIEKRDWAKLEEMHTPDFVYHTPDSPKPQTRDDLMQSVSGLSATFPDFHNTIEDMIAEGNKVVIRETLRGTNKGELKELGLPATGKKVTLPMIHIFRIEDGKIAETWESYNATSMMQQLGLMPSGG